MEERVQKILAQLGYGSRRSCEDLIIQGRVTVNGAIVEIGSKAEAGRDKIAVDGKDVPATAPKPVYIMVHKPQYVLSVQDENDQRRKVFDLVPDFGHLFAVGRLDFDSEGLMLLTNDGELANRLTHPRYGHEKEYKVLVIGEPDGQQLRAWRSGVVLEDGYRTQPAAVEMNHNDRGETWLTVTMKEGRKRQIREVGARIGLPVKRIIRVRLANLELGKLKVGQWRHLTAQEEMSLKRTAGIKPESMAGRKTARPVGPARKPMGKPGAKPAGKPAGKPAEKPARRPVGKPTSSPAGKPVGKPVDKPGERSKRFRRDS